MSISNARLAVLQRNMKDTSAVPEQHMHQPEEHYKRSVTVAPKPSVTSALIGILISSAGFDTNRARRWGRVPPPAKRMAFRAEFPDKSDRRIVASVRSR